MKNLFLFITLIVSFLSSGQNEIIYISVSPKNSEYQDIINLFVNQKDPESLVNILKKEIKKSEFFGEETSKSTFRFRYFDDLENKIPVVGLHSNLFKNLGEDTIEMNLKGYSCATRNRDGIEAMTCDEYYSLDGLAGIVLLKGIKKETLEKLNINSNSEEYNFNDYTNFYGQDRIGFVRLFAIKNKIDSTEIDLKKCITFSIPISSVVKLTNNKSWEKNYKNLFKKTIASVQKQPKHKDSILFDYKNVKAISDQFYHESDYRYDLHFGLKIFSY